MSKRTSLFHILDTDNIKSKKVYKKKNIKSDEDFIFIKRLENVIIDDNYNPSQNKVLKKMNNLINNTNCKAMELDNLLENLEKLGIINDDGLVEDEDVEIVVVDGNDGVEDEIEVMVNVEVSSYENNQKVSWELLKI